MYASPVTSTLLARPARTLVATAAALLATASVAHGAWRQPVPTPSPLNVSPTLDGVDAAVASVAGVPHVAWRETDGTNMEVRVARLTPAGWERIGAVLNPASPVNQDSLGSATGVAIADVGGVPHVAWAEADGTNTEIRVARLTPDGSAWERVGAVERPASPVNVSAERNAASPSIAAVGGVPYVAWAEADGVNTEIRVARLNAAGTGWEQVGAAERPGSPLNRSASRGAGGPSLAVVAGVPHVAWTEDDGTNDEVRVARLNPAGTGWQPVGQTLRPGSPVNEVATRDARGASLVDLGGLPAVAWVEETLGAGSQVRVSRLSSGGLGWERLGRALRPGNPVNQSRARSATAPGLAVVAGRPWVAWAEEDGRNREVRVARLNSAGTGWEQPVGGGSPVNVSAGRDADAPSLAAVGEVPYVAWPERDSQNREMRVARLEPEVLQLSAIASEETLRFEARLRSFGLPYQVGFQLSGGGTARETRPGPLVGDPSLASAVATGLRSGVTYQWRTFAVMGANGLRAVGPAQVITTTAVRRLAVTVPGARRAFRARQAARTGIVYRLNLRARVTVVLSRNGRVVRRLVRRGEAGRNVVAFRAPLRTGTYRVAFSARASGDRVDRAAARLVVTPRRRR